MLNSRRFNFGLTQTQIIFIVSGIVVVLLLLLIPMFFFFHKQNKEDDKEREEEEENKRKQKELEESKEKEKENKSKNKSKNKTKHNRSFSKIKHNKNITNNTSNRNNNSRSTKFTQGALNSGTRGTISNTSSNNDNSNFNSLSFDNSQLFGGQSNNDLSANQNNNNNNNNSNRRNRNLTSSNQPIKEVERDREALLRAREDERRKQEEEQKKKEEEERVKKEEEQKAREEAERLRKQQEEEQEQGDEGREESEEEDKEGDKQDYVWVVDEAITINGKACSYTGPALKSGDTYIPHTKKGERVKKENSDETMLADEGDIKFNNNSEYKGEIVNGKMHGKGTMTWPNVDKYVGDFQDNRIHGKGTYIFPNEDEYEGEFENNESNDTEDGRIFCKSFNITYKGPIRGNLMDNNPGVGIVTSPKISKYMCKPGEATITYCNDHAVFKGTFDENGIGTGEMDYGNGNKKKGIVTIGDDFSCRFTERAQEQDYVYNKEFKTPLGVKYRYTGPVNVGNGKPQTREDKGEKYKTGTFFLPDDRKFVATSFAVDPFNDISFARGTMYYFDNSKIESVISTTNLNHVNFIPIAKSTVNVKSHIDIEDIENKHSKTVDLSDTGSLADVSGGDPEKKKIIDLFKVEVLRFIYLVAHTLIDSEVKINRFVADEEAICVEIKIEFLSQTYSVSMLHAFSNKYFFSMTSGRKKRKGEKDSQVPVSMNFGINLEDSKYDQKYMEYIKKIVSAIIQDKLNDETNDLADKVMLDFVNEERYKPIFSKEPVIDLKNAKPDINLYKRSLSTY